MGAADSASAATLAEQAGLQPTAQQAEPDAGVAAAVATDTAATDTAAAADAAATDAAAADAQQAGGQAEGGGAQAAPDIQVKAHVPAWAEACTSKPCQYMQLKSGSVNHDVSGCWELPTKCFALLAAAGGCPCLRWDCTAAPDAAVPAHACRGAGMPDHCRPDHCLPAVPHHPFTVSLFWRAWRGRLAGALPVLGEAQRLLPGGRELEGWRP